MSEETAITVREVAVTTQSLDGSRTPAEAVERAAEEASAIMACIEDRKMFSMIQGGKHLKIEAWQMLAAYKGCLPREAHTEELEDGSFLCKAQLVRINDGVVIAEAVMSCGDKTDKPWCNRPKYARRSMAITRACGKVCRMTFGYIAHMAGYKTTPAEEMPQDDASRRKGTDARPATPSQLSAIEDLSKHPAIGEDVASSVRDALEEGVTQRRAGNLIKRLNEIIKEAGNDSEG